MLNGLDIIDTYTVEKISNPVSNEYLSASGSRVIYQNGTLSLEHLDGYHFYLMTMEGKILRTFIARVPHELRHNLPYQNYLFRTMFSVFHI